MKVSKKGDLFMSDVLFSLCGKLEKYYSKGFKEYQLTGRDLELMERHRRDIISMLRDFDGIDCRFDDISGRWT